MTIPSRPTTLTEEMKQRAAEEVAGNLLEEGHINESQFDMAIRDIAKHGTLSMDGYQLARELDRWEHWDCDLDMAEALDGWSAAAEREIKQAQRTWVAENNIQPPFPVGTKVVATWGREDHRGTIHQISDYHPASYLVTPEDEAVTTGQMVVAFENARSLDATPVYGADNG